MDGFVLECTAWSEDLTVPMGRCAVRGGCILLYIVEERRGETLTVSFVSGHGRAKETIFSSEHTGS